MHDVLGAMFLVHLRQARRVGDVADHRYELELGMGLAQLQVHEVQVALGLIEQHQPGRPEGRDLAGQLGPDGAGGPGQQHHTVAKVCRHRRQIQIHRRPTQQVLDPYVAELIHARRALQQLVQRRKCLELETSGDALVDHPSHLGEMSRLQCDDGELRPQFAAHGGQIIDRADHADATDGPSLTGAVQVDQPDRMQRVHLCPACLAQDLLGPLAHPDDQRPPPSRGGEGNGAFTQ